MFKFILSRVKEIDSRIIMSSLIQAITIVAFFFAIEYFSASPSLEVRLSNIQSSGYNFENIQKFYDDNDTNMPDIIRECLEDTMNMRINAISDTAISGDMAKSHLDYLDELNQGKKWRNFLLKNVIELEKHLDSFQYTKHIYFWNDDNKSYYPMKEYNTWLAKIKNRLSEKDYYILLCASIYSRTFDDICWIRNTGDTDLRNIIINIPSPFSTITNNRANNILQYQIIDIVLADIKLHENKTEIYIPFLEKGESFSINFELRENMINKDEIYYTYDSEINFKKGKIFLYLVFILMIVLAVNTFFRHAGAST